MTITYASCDDSCYSFSGTILRPGQHYLDARFHRYTEGDCGLLALAISARTGWSVRWLEGGRGGHAVVELPDGRFLDVTGTVTWDELTEYWHDPVDVVPWEGPGAYLERSIDETTERIAEELIALVMAEEVPVRV